MAVAGIGIRRLLEDVSAKAYFICPFCDKGIENRPKSRHLSIFSRKAHLVRDYKHVKKSMKKVLLLKYTQMGWKKHNLYRNRAALTWPIWGRCGWAPVMAYLPRWVPRRIWLRRLDWITEVKKKGIETFPFWTINVGNPGVWCLIPLMESLEDQLKPGLIAVQEVAWTNEQCKAFSRKLDQLGFKVFHSGCFDSKKKGDSQSRGAMLWIKSSFSCKLIAANNWHSIGIVVKWLQLGSMTSRSFLLTPCQVKSMLSMLPNCIIFCLVRIGNGGG